MPKRSWSQLETATTNGGGPPVPAPGAWPKAADRKAPISSIRLIYTRHSCDLPFAERPPSVRYPSADRPLNVRWRRSSKPDCHF